VQWLVYKYPTALMTANDHGELPFHLAACHGAGLDTVYFILRQSPSCLCLPSRLKTNRTWMKKSIGI
jgi:hypothetical protein